MSLSVPIAFVVALLVLPFAAQAAEPPLLIAPPVVLGEPLVGGHLTVRGVVVENATNDDVTLIWERSRDEGTYTEIEDAFGESLEITTADVGRRLRVCAIVETAAGIDRLCSESTDPVGLPPVVTAPSRIRVGPVSPSTNFITTASGPAVVQAGLSRWIITAGDELRVEGRILGAGERDETVTLVLEATVSAYAALVVRAPLILDAGGRISGTVQPLVNAVAWLEVETDGVEPTRVRLGVVGVRPYIRLRLGASPDGHDQQGRPLVRDLVVLPGSVLTPRIEGLRLGWEGILPGESRGTAVCRSEERVVAANEGVLRGGCATRKAWSAARWRLVYDPGTDNPGATPFLAGVSRWVHPGQALAIPVVPRGCATLAAWNLPTFNSSSNPRCPVVVPRSTTSWEPAATTSRSGWRPSSSPVRA